MGSIIAMSRTASLKIKNAAKAAKKTMSASAAAACKSPARGDRPGYYGRGEDE